MIGTVHNIPTPFHTTAVSRQEGRAGDVPGGDGGRPRWSPCKHLRAHRLGSAG
ncbi:unnamed protein product [Ectocarpus sp. 4 AP-2014]